MSISNEQTWAIFWFAVIVAICTLIGSCTIMSNNEDARKAQDMKALIAQGQSPIEARCAVYGTGNRVMNPGEYLPDAHLAALSS